MIQVEINTILFLSDYILVSLVFACGRNKHLEWRFEEREWKRARNLFWQWPLSAYVGHMVLCQLKLIANTNFFFNRYEKKGRKNKINAGIFPFKSMPKLSQQLLYLGYMEDKNNSVKSVNLVIADMIFKLSEFFSLDYYSIFSWLWKNTIRKNLPCVVSIGLLNLNISKSL